MSFAQGSTHVFHPKYTARKDPVRIILILFIWFAFMAVSHKKRNVLKTKYCLSFSNVVINNFIYNHPTSPNANPFQFRVYLIYLTGEHSQMCLSGRQISTAYHWTGVLNGPKSRRWSKPTLLLHFILNILIMCTHLSQCPCIKNACNHFREGCMQYSTHQALLPGLRSVQ